jgi:hypothetical protein
VHRRTTGVGAVLVFIDESGDAGFKFECGSSPIFVVAMVAFASHKEAQRAAEI